MLPEHFRQGRLLVRGIIAMKDVFLRGCIDRLVDRRQYLPCFVFLSLLNKIRVLTHHCLQFGLEGLAACTTLVVLARAFDGGLNQWHRAGKE